MGSFEVVPEPPGGQTIYPLALRPSGELAPSSAVQCIPWLSNEPPFLRSIDAYRNLPDTSALFIWNGANQKHHI